VAKGQSDLKTGIETTIDATKPRAAIDLISLRPTGELLQVAANMPLVFDLNYTNSGTDTATKFACLFHVYIGKPDDPIYQEEILADFYKRWNTHEQKSLGDVGPGATCKTSFVSDPRTTMFLTKPIDPTIRLTGPEAASVLAGTNTIYFVFRFSWADQSGEWLSDTCMAYQNPLHDVDIRHSCSDGKREIGNKKRYRISSTNP
jgi:hypothetical protein